MREISIPFYIGLILSFSSCSKEKRHNSYQDEFASAIEKIDSDYIDHFPRKIDENATILLSEEKFVSHPKIWIKDHNSKDIEKLEYKLRQKAAGTYLASDSCLLVIEPYLSQNNHRDYDCRNASSERVEYDSCSLGNLPIPNFWDESFFESDSSCVGLSLNYILYVLDAKNQLVFPLEKLPNGKNTWTGWEHGYSKGVAIDRKQQTVIYWFDVW